MKTIPVQNGILPLTPAGLETDGCVCVKILVEKGGNRVKTLGRQPAAIQSAPAGIAPFKISNPMKKSAHNFPKLFSALLLLLALGLPAATARAQCTPPPSGLVGWWKGDGTAADSVATNNGTLVNVSYSNGIAGQAFAFDPENFSFGTYTGVQIADQPAYALTNSMTIEGWIRVRGASYTIFFRGDHRPGLDPYSISEFVSTYAGWSAICTPV